MKKLLKSILIATASVGAVAGTTAAVVSCGTVDAQAEANAVVDYLSTKAETTPLPDSDQTTTLANFIQLALTSIYSGGDGIPKTDGIDTAKEPVITISNRVAATGTTGSSLGHFDLTIKFTGKDGKDYTSKLVTIKTEMTA